MYNARGYGGRARVDRRIYGDPRFGDAIARNARQHRPRPLRASRTARSPRPRSAPRDLGGRHARRKTSGNPMDFRNIGHRANRQSRRWRAVDDVPEPAGLRAAYSVPRVRKPDGVPELQYLACRPSPDATAAMSPLWLHAAEARNLPRLQRRRCLRRMRTGR